LQKNQRTIYVILILCYFRYELLLLVNILVYF